MTVIKTLDHHDAIELLRTVVMGKEDFVYTPFTHIENVQSKCAYSVSEGDDYVASCIVGHAVYEYDKDMFGLLVAFEHSAKVGFTSFSAITFDAFFEKIEDAPFAVTAAASQVFSVAQGEQDNGATWGQSLKRAESHYNRLCSPIRSQEVHGG